MEPFQLSEATRVTAGTLLLTLVAVEIGGLFVLSVVRGRIARTPFQLAFARAGHAHAGVLVTLSLVVQLFVDATTLTGIAATIARSAIPLAAIVMPAGFFLSSAGAGRTAPNGLIALVYLGTVALGAGAVALGLGLLLGPG